MKDIKTKHSSNGVNMVEEVEINDSPSIGSRIKKGLKNKSVKLNGDVVTEENVKKSKQALNKTQEGNVEKKKKVDHAKLRRLLQEQNDYIKNLMEIAQIPSHDYEEAQDDVFVGKKKQSKQESKEAHRAKSFQDLKNRFDKLKGTVDYSVKKKLLKKSLSKRLKQKSDREERKKRKKLARIEKSKAHGNVAVKQESAVETDKTVVKPTKPVFNSQGRVVFSKFDFSDSGIPEPKRKGERDHKKILENLQKQKDQVRELKESGETDKATALMEKIAWKNALAKAEGQKIKDDPLLLKKTLKRKEQEKNRSAKKWDQRLEGVKKAKEDREKKRSTNIQKRNEGKKKKILQKAVKRGRMIQ